MLLQKQLGIGFNVISNPFSGKSVLWLGIGQSNMIGRGGPVDSVLDAPQADILEYNAAGDSFAQAAEPIDHFNENTNQIGPMMTFAKDFVSDFGAERVLLVGAAQGGSGFIAGDWNAGGNGTIYNNAKSRWNAAYARAVTTYGVGNVIVGGVLWIQGEDEAIDYSALFDGSGEGDNYQTMPMHLAETIRRTWDGMSLDTPFILGEIPGASAISTTAGANIQSAIVDIPNHLPYSAAAAETGTTYLDDRHWDAPGSRTMGSRMAAQVANARANAISISRPMFTPDPSNVETCFAFDARGAADATPVYPSMVANGYREFDNKRVFIKNGAFQFDGDCEMRWRGNGKPELSNRDFLIKVHFNTTSDEEQGIIADYVTAGNQRGFVCRINTGPVIQFYTSSNGTGANLHFQAAISTNTDYEVEIKRVGTALTLHLNGVLQGSDTLTSGYTVFDTPNDQPLLIGDFQNGRELEGHMDHFSLEFLS
jgi:hypothetical protein